MRGVQCSCCGLHGAVSIIISFRAYNLTSREFQVINEPPAIWSSLKDPQAGQLFLAAGLVELCDDGDLAQGISRSVRGLRCHRHIRNTP